MGDTKTYRSGKEETCKGISTVPKSFRGYRGGEENQIRRANQKKNRASWQSKV